MIDTVRIVNGLGQEAWIIRRYDGLFYDSGNEPGIGVWTDKLKWAVKYADRVEAIHAKLDLLSDEWRVDN